ncbi:hypothetical protein GCM10010252_00370 [Streptomyces aureoverticillatus]|nr:hypothetical protein GCM10010252_00370 [Streptomyces aureoverticillatus]
MLRDKKSWAVMAGVVLGVSTLTGVGTASADDYTCDKREFCLWENPYFNRGSQWDTYGFAQWNAREDGNYNNNKWRDKKVPAHDEVDVLDNEASSARNRTYCGVILWQHVGHGGARTTLYIDREKAFLEDENVGDNRASSHSFVC